MYDGFTMPFPLTIGDTTLTAPDDLMRRVLEHFARDEHTDASEWLKALYPEQLNAQELTALTAALTTRPEPRALCTAAHLTTHLEDSRLGALLLQACLSVDLGTLLTPASSTTDVSIEDLLLEAIVVTAALEDEETRSRLLMRLRGAGHSQHEVDILCAHGTASEIAQSLPGILAEGTQLTQAQHDRMLARSQDDLEHGAHVRRLLTDVV